MRDLLAAWTQSGDAVAACDYFGAGEGLAAVVRLPDEGVQPKRIVFRRLI